MWLPGVNIVGTTTLVCGCKFDRAAHHPMVWSACAQHKSAEKAVVGRSPAGVAALVTASTMDLAGVSPGAKATLRALVRSVIWALRVAGYNVEKLPP